MNSKLELIQVSVALPKKLAFHEMFTHGVTNLYLLGGEEEPEGPFVVGASPKTIMRLTSRNGIFSWEHSGASLLEGRKNFVVLTFQY